VPILNDLYSKLSLEVNLVAVTFDSPVTVNAFNEKYKYKWNSLLNAGDLIKEVGVKTYPTFILLDENSQMISYHTGYDTDLKKSLLSMLK
jgi:thioredoxin-related protein